LELADFLGIVFRLQHHERIIGYTRFSTSLHDAIWMEVRMEINDKKGHHRCVECGHGTFACPFRASQELYLTKFPCAVLKPQSLGGAEEHGYGHH
jgi:hypothetical protein